MKKIFNTISVCFVLNLILIQLNYSMEQPQAFEGSQVASVEQLGRNNFSALRAYYIQNPWDFVEQKFVIDNLSEDGAAFSSFCIFIGITALTAGAIGLSGVGLEIHSNRYLDNQKMVQIAAVSALSGFVVGLISAIAFYNHLISMRYKELISILNSYNPDLSKPSSNNTKFCIPKELHLVFDTLWNVYKKRGEEALKEEWDRVAKLVTKQILLNIANPDFKVKFVDDVNLRVIKLID